MMIMLNKPMCLLSFAELLWGHNQVSLNMNFINACFNPGWKY